LSSEGLTIREARQADAGALALIYNQGIDDRIVTFETEKRTQQERRSWLIRHDEKHPVIVAAAGRQVVGWASISPYSQRTCYSGVGEFSVYVRRDKRGIGVGAKLLESLLEKARTEGYWKLIGRIFAHNAASRRLAERFGFREVGILENHAKLDGRWLDVVEVEKLIHENIDQTGK
jgi:phosphinothricin acetyltransferase